MAVEIDAIQSAKSIGWTDALLSRLAANSVGLGARLSITTPANASALSSTGYSLTGSNASSMIDLAGAWNTTGNPVAMRIAISNTASGSTAKFAEFLAGASGTTEVFSVDKSGNVTLSNIKTASAIQINSGNTNDLRDLYVRGCFGQTFTFLSGVTTLTAMLGESANVVALRNSTAAQAFNVYGTYTSGSVYERGAVYADSNGFNIAHQQLGSTKRPVRILGHDLASAEAVSALEINQTWNTSGNPVGLKMAITNTASGATAKFLSFLAGASGTTEVFSVAKDGSLSAYTATISDYVIAQGLSGTNAVSIGSFSAVTMNSSGRLRWAASTNANVVDASCDLFLLRDAANTLALRNGTSAQAFNIYNTYTSGSVYERGFVRWVSNVLEIGTEHVGASARGLSFKIGSTAAITIGTAGTISLLQDCYANLGGNNVVEINQLGIGVNSAGYFAFSSTTNSGAGKDAGIKRTIAGVVGVTNGSTGGGALGLIEMTSPAAPATNGVYIFAEDNGGGKTRLMARFATGATQQIAIEP